MILFMIAGAILISQESAVAAAAAICLTLWLVGLPLAVGVGIATGLILRSTVGVAKPRRVEKMRELVEDAWVAKKCPKTVSKKKSTVLQRDNPNFKFDQFTKIRDCRQRFRVSIFPHRENQAF